MKKCLVTVLLSSAFLGYNHYAHGAHFNALRARGSGIILTPENLTTTLPRFTQVINTAGLADNTFGILGTTTTTIGAPGAVKGTVYAAAIQADGKVIAVGTNAAGTNWQLARYNTNGTLDTTYGTNGVVSGPADTPRATLIQPTDGKLVVAGDVNGQNAIIRYNTNGSQDVVFSTETFFGSTTSAHAILLQPADNKIVIAGPYTNAGTPNFLLARFNPDGSIDNTFGTGGYTTTSHTGIANAVTLAAGNKIVAAGNDGAGNFCLAQYTTTGTLDVTFNPGGAHPGIVASPAGNANAVLYSTTTQYPLLAAGFGSSASPETYNLNGTDEGPYASVIGTAQTLLQQADTKVVLVATNAGSFIVARYGAGTLVTLDPTFGNAGIATGPAGTAGGGVLQADGKIVVAGTNNGYFSLVRYTTNGTIDPTYHTVGQITGTIRAAILQSNNQLVGLGTDGESFTLARYNPNGSLDTQFGTAGLVKGPDGVAYAALLQSNGAIIGVGTDGESLNFSIARYLSNGALDSSFGAGAGYVAGPAGTAISYGAVLQPNNQIIAVGTTVAAGGDVCVVRYNTDGTVDTNYGGGLVTGAAGTFYAALLQPDGKLIALGQAGANCYLVRYTAQGTIDTTFGGGPITGPLGTFSAGLLQPNGQIVAVGTSHAGTFFASRYNTDGTIDTTFGTSGTATGPTGTAYAALLQSNGKIVLLGVVAGNFAVARFNSNGSVDTSFGTGTSGYVIGTAGTIYAALLQPNNQIVGLGNAGAPDFCLSRYINPFTAASYLSSSGSVGLN